MMHKHQTNEHYDRFSSVFMFWINDVPVDCFLRSVTCFKTFRCRRDLSQFECLHTYRSKVTYREALIDDED